MVELKALNLHWLENSEPERDLCAHGSVYLKLNNNVVSEFEPTDWTVNTSAYRLLKTLKENHIASEDDFLIPHCGFTMWEIGEEKELYIGGCNIGINWSIRHSEDKLIHEIAKDVCIETDFNEWRNAVCSFSDEIMKFYEKSSPKLIEDEEDKKGFELFIREWKRLRAEAFD